MKSIPFIFNYISIRFGHELAGMWTEGQIGEENCGLDLAGRSSVVRQFEVK